MSHTYSYIYPILPTRYKNKRTQIMKSNLKKIALAVTGAIMTLTTLNASDEIQSYKASFDALMKQRAAAPAKYSKEDRKVMTDATAALERDLPNPGIQVGQKAPLFTLKNAFGKEVSLEKELAKGPVILVFYRGSWCPYCNMHLHVLQGSLDSFKKYGAQLITVSPQSPDKSAEQLKKDGYPFEVLSDYDNDVMKSYKLYFEVPQAVLDIYKQHDLDIETKVDAPTALPVPGSFVIDTKGVVRAMQAQTDYTIRMEPKDIIDALKEISKDK